MKKNSRLIGDHHVQNVQTALIKYLNKQPIDNYPATIIETVMYIYKLHSNIEKVYSKLDQVSTTTNDLTLKLSNQQLVHINLFLIQKGKRIQSKNIGAKSFLSKYFLAEDLQEEFNKELQKHESIFFEALFNKRQETTTEVLEIARKKIKKNISMIYPDFTKEIDCYRDTYLFELREACFLLLQRSYNQRNQEIIQAFHTLLMTNDINIITTYLKDGSVGTVELFDPKIKNLKDLQLYKVGNDTVGIRFGEIALTLRFKFESGPASSIKLAVSYAVFPKQQEITNLNQITINEVERLLNDHSSSAITKDSNAIGKCHEAFTYYYFLKRFPNVLQVDTNKCSNLLRQYSPNLQSTLLNKVYTSTPTIIEAIKNHFDQKYEEYTIQSIALIPDSYIQNRLSTGDLQLILDVKGESIIEDISLKTTAKKSNKIATKNPGIGTILGSTYFDIGNIDATVQFVKSQYEAKVLNHQQSLEMIASELGQQLQGAAQIQLQKGIANLLGKAVMAITFYEANQSFCKEHTQVNSKVNVLVKTPSSIQNTLKWSQDTEEISLRVKFSRGQNHGWSSIKLTSEYRLNI